MILEAYKAWGTDCLKHLVGMFALAIWDTQRKCLVLARDRLGKKPLFLQRLADDGLIFASELKGLRQHHAASLTINADALDDFLSLNYLLTDQCILAGVEKPPPGHALIAELNAPVKISQYWNIAEKFHEKRHYPSKAAAAEELDDLLQSAVRGQLLCEVLLGPS